MERRGCIAWLTQLRAQFTPQITLPFACLYFLLVASYCFGTDRATLGLLLLCLAAIPALMWASLARKD